jgi:hypothetical protein
LFLPNFHLNLIGLLLTCFGTRYITIVLARVFASNLGLILGSVGVVVFGFFSVGIGMGHVCIARSRPVVSSFVPLFNDVFGCARNFVSTVYINGSLIEWQLCKWVTHKCVHFLINMLFDFIVKIFIVCLLLLFIGVDDIPVSGEDTCI